MGYRKSKVDYLMEYGNEIYLFIEVLSLRRVRNKTVRAIGTLQKLRTLFVR